MTTRRREQPRGPENAIDFAFDAPWDFPVFADRTRPDIVGSGQAARSIPQPLPIKDRIDENWPFFGHAAFGSDDRVTPPQLAFALLPSVAERKAPELPHPYPSPRAGHAGEPPAFVDLVRPGRRLSRADARLAVRLFGRCSRRNIPEA